VKFSDLIDHASVLLQRSGRMTYRALKREFDLSDEDLDILKEELIEARELAVDKDGKMLVWVGQERTGDEGQPKPSFLDATRQPLDARPISYTPPHLVERIRAEQAALEARGESEGERKTITALFADLKGSTALIEGLDPEEARAIIDPALQLMMDAVHRYEGYVAQALGDGIFALFGAPLAHEDHPQRALYAALRMQEEMRRYSDQLRLGGGAPLQMRVGVNTGEVVVRSIRKDDLHTDYVPVGHSTNLAARMEQLANPGSILVTDHTQRLTAGYFQFKALGAAQVKGVAEPLPIYEVVGVGPLRTRLQISARRGLTRFVGRQGEMDQMRRALEQARAGHGQIVGVMGDPGVGKSRLFYECKLTSHSGCLVLEAFSVSHGKASPYLPVIELLKQYFQITPQDDELQRQEKITGKVLTLDRSLEDTLPYVFALLGIADPTSSLPQMDPQIRRRKTFEALKRLLVRESLKQPLILSFEDLHWIDTETQGLLDILSESVATARVLLLGNYRPEYRHEWGNKTFYTQLRLDPLGQEDAQELLTALLEDDTALQPLKQFILEKTEGNPFFMEEIVQALAEEKVLGGERGNYCLEKFPTELHLPSTVQGILAARIDRLPPEEKALLQTLAVIGKEFSLSLLKPVVEKPEGELQGLLGRLQAAEFIYEQPAFPEVEYTFKHALTQEVAYNSLLIERRKVLHERTAQAIEVLFHSQLEDHYGDLAHHYSRSSNIQKAVEYLHLAGQQAVQRSANAEAINHLTTALELLKTLPDTPERSQQELALHITLGAPLMATKGYAAPEVGKAYSRARELCQQVGETPQLFPVLHGLWNFYVTGGELKAAHELGEQLLSLAQSLHDPTLLLEAHRALGETCFWLGEFVLAREQTTQSLVLYDPRQRRSLVLLYAEDPGVVCQGFAAWGLWFLGYPDQALHRQREALTLAHELSHPFSLAIALGHAAVLHQLRREGHLARERAEALITLSTEQGFPFWGAIGTIQCGWARAEQGQVEEGIAQIRQGMAAFGAIGAEANQPRFLALLAEAYGKAGQVEEGLAALAEALTVVDKTGERFYEAELYRIKGTLTLEARGWRLEVSPSSSQAPSLKSQVSQAVAQEAEGYFLKAIEIARQQQAKSLELRAVMSLSRLWQQQGKQKEAHEMLSELYGWFTEGFDTKDLQEAKALLESLSS
jgi:class 3 adenylate cyclase/predicted ATPase